MSNRGTEHNRGRGGNRGRGTGHNPEARGRGRGTPFTGPPRGSPRGGPPVHGSHAGLIFNPTPNIPTTVDSYITATRLPSQVEPRTFEHPQRPGYGTLGKAIVLRANFFPIMLSKRVFYEYNVNISPEPKSQKMRVKNRILQLFEQSPQGAPYTNSVVHDGDQRLVSAVKLPQPLVAQVGYFEAGDSGPHQGSDQYEVTIEYQKDLSTEPLLSYIRGVRVDKEVVDPLISALNLVLQKQASQTGYRVSRNKFFFEDEDTQRIGQLFALMGFYSSVRPVHNQLMVNVNVCMTAFYQPGNLKDAYNAFVGASRGASPHEFLANIKVSTRHMGYKRIHTIRRILGNKPARVQTFPYNGGTITVENFFKTKYNINLRNADLPVVDVGQPGKPVYFPMEVCVIETGEAHYGKLSADETRDMIKYASRKPAVNAHLIVNKGLSKLGLSTVTPVLNAFGVSISSRMATIPARILPPPSISYQQGRPRVNNGSWNIVNVKFYKGGNMNNWKVVAIQDGNRFDPRGFDNLIRQFAAKCRSSGIVTPAAVPQLVTTPLLPHVSRDPGRVQALEVVRRTLEQLGPAKGISIVVVLLSEKDDFIYPGIKRIASVNLGIRTQCIFLPNALKDERKMDQYLSNIALKVNTKLGGVNHRLDNDAMAWLTKEKTLMVGIDVTHPGPKSVRGTPSIAGVVANIDQDFVQFPASLSLQKSKQEGIARLSDMMVERLVTYRKHTKSLPSRVFVFRDGVSEGQYDKVLREELPQILDAFKHIDPQNAAYRPKLSIVICGKRHHARFPATAEDHADQKNGNTLPGTVVDQGITAVFDFDFYLQAHAGLQGTVRPTHYVVIYDENSLGANMVQQGIHTTSYLYARATKAVSLIPPAYYADVVCEQARYWIHGFLNLAGDVSTVQDESIGGTPKGGKRGKGKGKGKEVGETSRNKREEQEQRVYEAAEKMWGSALHENLREVMFYL